MRLLPLGTTCHALCAGSSTTLLGGESSHAEQLSEASEGAEEDAQLGDPSAEPDSSWAKGFAKKRKETLSVEHLEKLALQAAIDE